MLERVAAVVEPTLAMSPPDLLQPRLARSVDAASRSAGRSGKLGTGAGEAVEILTGAARPILDRWFESEELKATLATDAIIGALASPVDAGHGLRAVPSRHGRDQRQARRVGLRARRHGRADAGAGRVPPATWASRFAARPRWRASSCATARRSGVALADGDEFHAPIVASNVDAHVTFLRLLDPRTLPADFVAAVERISYESASLKINVALAELPNFTALPGHGARPAASRHDPHLPRPGLHRARLRRRQVRPPIAASRSWSARCPRSSTPRSRRPAST